MNILKSNPDPVPAGISFYDPKSRTPHVSWSDIASMPDQPFLLWQALLAHLPAGVYAPPWLEGYIMPRRRYGSNGTTDAYDMDMIYTNRTNEPFIVWWKQIASVVTHSNFDPNASYLPSLDNNIIYPSPFPTPDDIKNNPSIKGSLNTNQINRIALYTSLPIVNATPQSWDSLLVDPTPHSIMYLAVMHCVQKAIDGGLVKKEVKPFPPWIEDLMVPQRRTISWEYNMQNQIQQTQFISDSDDYKSKKGFGPRSKYWQSILQSCSLITRWWLGDDPDMGDTRIDTGLSKILKREIALLKSHGLRPIQNNGRGIPIEDPLNFVIELCTRLTTDEIPNELKKDVSDNIKSYVKSVLDELSAPRVVPVDPKKQIDINAGVGILYRVWHPLWNSVYPEDSALLQSPDPEDRNFSHLEPAIQARPPFFPWHISTEHGGPDNAEGTPLNKDYPQPPDYLPLRYRAYDSYCTHPDEQMTFYQKMIAAVENNSNTAMFLPPPTWFDGYFLERLQTGKWDHRRIADEGTFKPYNGDPKSPVNDKKWDFVDKIKDPQMVDISANDYYGPMNEMDHSLSGNFYKIQLDLVRDEDNYDGLSDPRSQFWYRLYYMHRAERPKGYMIEFMHPPHRGKTYRFFKSLLHGIEKIEGAVVGAATDLVEIGLKSVIRSASQLTSSIINETAKDIKPVFNSFKNLGTSILSVFGIKMPNASEWEKRIMSYITLMIIIAVAYKIYVLSTRKRRD